MAPASPQGHNRATAQTAEEPASFEWQNSEGAGQAAMFVVLELYESESPGMVHPSRIWSRKKKRSGPQTPSAAPWVKPRVSLPPPKPSIPFSFEQE